MWRAFVAIRTRPDLDAITVNVDHGTAVLRVAPNQDRLELPTEMLIRELTYGELDANRARWLRPHSLDDGFAWIDAATNTRRDEL